MWGLQTETRSIYGFCDRSIYHISIEGEFHIWSTKTILQFLGNIKNAYRNDVAEHFIGTLVAEPRSDDYKTNILHGQDILLTILLILSALKNYTADKNNIMTYLYRQRLDENNPRSPRVVLHHEIN